MCGASILINMLAVDGRSGQSRRPDRASITSGLPR
jgi:hypothetical protein